MSCNSRRLIAPLVVVVLSALLPACGQRTERPKVNGSPPDVGIVAEGPAVQEAAQPPASIEPTEIELSDAKVTFVDKKQIRFEVKYRVTKGTADKYYELDVFSQGLRTTWRNRCGARARKG